MARRTKRRGYKKKSFKRRRYIPARYKKYVQAVVNKNTETKYVGSAVADLAVSDSQTDVNIITMTYGDGRANRTGNEVRLTGFYGKFRMLGADTTNTIRVIMYIPKDPSQILASANTYGMVDPAVATILYDRLHTTSSMGTNVRVFTIAKKFRGAGLSVRWDQNGANIMKNHVKMLFVSDSGAISHPTLSYDWRIYFKDA